MSEIRTLARAVGELRPEDYSDAYRVLELLGLPLDSPVIPLDCETCGGSGEVSEFNEGIDPDDRWKPCPTCGGRPSFVVVDAKAWDAFVEALRENWSYLPGDADSECEAAALRIASALLPGVRDIDLGAIRQRLEQICRGEGAFNRDPLIHAENTIDAMKEEARAALALIADGQEAGE
jgi:hypothetical protein